MNEAAMQAVALWVGLNIGLMFMLAMNVVRYRRMGEAADPARLEGAIRAHGNNTEYVPVILLGMATLAAMGTVPGTPEAAPTSNGPLGRSQESVRG